MADRGLVLVVTDDAATGVALREILGRERYVTVDGDGVTTATVPTGATSADLVLLDVDLRRADPFEVLARLRSGEWGRDVPVIFMVARDDAENWVRGLETGDDLLVKPFDAREVLARIERQVTVSKVRMALQESEAKFRSVMESAIDAIISADGGGMIRSWNSAASALFGFTEAEVLGHPIEMIIPLRYRDSHRTGIRRVTSGGPSHVIGKTVELAAIRKDGSEFPVELSLATWFLDDGRYYTGIIRDISERKQAEQKFRSVTESAIDAIISADHTGRIVSWNQAATRILGFTEEEAVGQRLELVIPQRYHELHRGGMARYAATGEPHVIGTTVELAARTKSGDEVPIELSLSTWTVRHARFYTGIIRDIRERKRAEEALRRSEQALRDKTEELRRKNEVMEQTLRQVNDMQNQLIMQEKMASLGKLSAGMAHELNNPAASAQRGAAQLQATFTRLQSVQRRMTALDMDEARTDALAVLDALARERAQHPVALTALERSDREAAVEDWLFAHETTVPGDVVPALVSLGYGEDDLDRLRAMVGEHALDLVVEWLSLKLVMHSLFAEIVVGTSRIVELVKALKTYTFLDQAPVQSVDVRQGLDNTLVILQNKLKRGGVSVVRQYADDLPAIEAYASELNQVWTNIIDNAVDAMGGRGRLVVRAWPEDSWVVVQIEDDGPGIPESARSKVFDPFFTTKPPGEGTGLGLNISRSIVVNKHHGDVSVESRPGRTCFTVRLPVGLGPGAQR